MPATIAAAPVAAGRCRIRRARLPPEDTTAAPARLPGMDAALAGRGLDGTGSAASRLEKESPCTTRLAGRATSGPPRNGQHRTVTDTSSLSPWPVTSAASKSTQAREPPDSPHTAAAVGRHNHLSGALPGARRPDPPWPGLGAPARPAP